MTVNRRAFQTPPKTWVEVLWTLRGPKSYSRWLEAKEWCTTHAGIDRADWENRGFVFRFRDPEMAMLFKLTWC